MPKEVICRTPGKDCCSYELRVRLHNTEPTAIFGNDVLPRGAHRSAVELRELADVLHEMASSIDGLHGWPQRLHDLIEFEPLLNDAGVDELSNGDIAAAGRRLMLGVMTQGGEDLLALLRETGADNWNGMIDQIDEYRHYLRHMLGLANSASRRLQVVTIYHTDQLTLQAAGSADGASLQ